jgi:nicotinamidase-related amidase
MAAPLVPGVTRLLERARAAGVLIAFTIPNPWRGKPYGQVYSGFGRKYSEAVFFPSGFDKFADGQLRTLLSLYDINTLILTGCKANMAILYTATRAIQEYKYNIVLPIDGIAATTDYERDYTLYQFRAYPDGSTRNFSFTKLDMINFK